MWNPNTIPKKRGSGPVGPFTVTVKNVGALNATLTATPVEGVTETVTLANGDSYVLLQEIEKGSAISTVYSSIAYEYPDSESGTIDVSTIINSNKEFKITSFTPTLYSVGLRNTDAEDYAIVLAIPVGDENESYVVYPGQTQNLLKAFEAGDTIATNYSYVAYSYDERNWVEVDTATVINSDTVIDMSKPITTYSIQLQNVDSSESCTVTATPVEGEVETYELANSGPQSYGALDKRVTEGNAVSTVYSSIVADFNGTTVSADVSLVANTTVEYTFAIPQPQLPTTIRLINNGSSTMSYTATPSDQGQAETGTVNAGELVNLDRTIDEGDPVSDAYSSITISYPNSKTDSVDVSTVATSSGYLDFTFDDVLPVTIYIENQDLGEAVNYQATRTSDGVTENGTIQAGGSVALTKTGLIGDELYQIYSSFALSYTSIPDVTLNKSNLLSDEFTTSTYTIPVSRASKLVLKNRSDKVCTVTYVPNQSTTQTTTIQPGDSFELQAFYSIGDRLDTNYSSITYEFAGVTGTQTVDLTRTIMDGPYFTLSLYEE